MSTVNFTTHIELEIAISADISPPEEDSSTSPGCDIDIHVTGYTLPAALTPQQLERVEGEALEKWVESQEERVEEKSDG